MTNTFGMQATALSISPTIAFILFTFTGIALYNTLELFVLVFVTFKRYRGLYFWSLLISTIGILPYTLGLMFKFFGVIKINYLTIAFICLGWQMMVTGQSVVLYSRLHLVSTNRKMLRAVLVMIIANAFISGVPTIVAVFGTNSKNPAPYARLTSLWERLQVVLYFVQECSISILYIVQVAKLQRVSGNRKNRLEHEGSIWEKPRRVKRHLIWVNLCMILLDASMVGVEFAGYYEIQVLYKVSLQPISTRRVWLTVLSYRVHSIAQSSSWNSGS
jgi:hypothetical protein